MVFRYQMLDWGLLVKQPDQVAFVKLPEAKDSQIGLFCQGNKVIQQFSKGFRSFFQELDEARVRPKTKSLEHLC